MPNYISFPIDTNPSDLLQKCFDFLIGAVPGWTPAEGNLDVWLAEAIATETSELTSVASRVPDTLFRYFGKSLVGLPAVDATSATATTTWTMRDNAGYTIPAGTQVSVRNAAGESIPFLTANSVTVPPGSTVTATGAITIVASDPGADGSGLGTPGGTIQLIDILDYVTTVTQVAATSGGLDAEADADYLNRLVLNLQLMTRTPIVPADFAKLTLNIAPAFRVAALDGYNSIHNLLSANASSVETSAAGWANYSNTTLAQSGAQFLDGIKSLSMVAIAAADMFVASSPAIAVLPGDSMTAVASFRANTTGRNCKVGLRWLTAGMADISVSYGSTVADTNAGWAQASVVAAAPATAAFVEVVAFVAAPVLGETHYMDKASVRRGAGTDWIIGDTLETGNARMITVVPVDSAGNALSAPAKSDIKTYLQALREINFVVNVMDPTYVNIDITTDIHVLTGFDAPTVRAAVSSALTNYLSPATWGQPIGAVDRSADIHEWINDTVVRLYDTSHVIKGVDGVDYIKTLTQGIHGAGLTAADVPIGSVVPLPTAGTITVTNS